VKADVLPLVAGVVLAPLTDVVASVRTLLGAVDVGPGGDPVRSSA
jgi:hypothetical protein